MAVVTTEEKWALWQEAKSTLSEGQTMSDLVHEALLLMMHGVYPCTDCEQRAGPVSLVLGSTEADSQKLALTLGVPAGYPTEWVNAQVSMEIPDAVVRSATKPDGPDGVYFAETPHRMLVPWHQLPKGAGVTSIRRMDVPDLVEKLTGWVASVNQWVEQQDMLPAETMTITGA